MVALCNMTLKEIVEKLGSYDDEKTIYLDRSSELTANSIGIVTWVPEDDSVPAEASGMSVFLDVWHALDVIAGKARLNNINSPSLDQKVQLLIDYARDGA